MDDRATTARSAAQQVLSGIGRWSASLNQEPGWEAWSRKRFGRVLFGDDDTFPHEEIPDFEFSDIINSEHKVIMAYLELLNIVNMLREVEWYFRRYPFDDQKVAKSSHLSHCCDMYFGKFYQFKERMRNLFDALTVHKPEHAYDVGALFKLFNKEFGVELRERNRVNHHERFEDLEISSILIQSQMASHMPESFWHKRSQAQYRKISKEWASRVRVRAARLDLFTEAIAAALLTACPFLSASR